MFRDEGREATSLPCRPAYLLLLLLRPMDCGKIARSPALGFGCISYIYLILVDSATSTRCTWCTIFDALAGTSRAICFSRSATINRGPLLRHQSLLIFPNVMNGPDGFLAGLIVVGNQQPSWRKCTAADPSLWIVNWFSLGR